MNRLPHVRIRPGQLLAFAALAALASLGRAGERSNDQNDVDVSVHHAIAGRLTGFGELEYRGIEASDSKNYACLWPGLTYTATTWLQFTGGLRSAYTDNTPNPDILELRPFVGVKVQCENRFKWNFYNYTRYEYRHLENLNAHTSTDYGRIRSRFAVEIPLCSTAKAWKPKTWYGLADIEPYYRLDTDTLDPVLLRAGLGYVLSGRFRAELLYQAQYARPSGGGPREVTANTVQLNVKIGLQEGLLRRLQNMNHGSETSRPTN
jgi:Protein of unknown function (DUF2490)